MKKIVLILTCILLTGCSLFNKDEIKENEIYTTTYPNQYLVNYLYGEYVNVSSIYPTGIDFLEYELSDKKLNDYAKSYMYIFNSQDIDRNYAVKMININPDLKIIDVALNMKQISEVEELWLNPYNYLMMAKNTKDSLSEYIIDPYRNQKIQNKNENLEYELSKLDATYKNSIDNAKYKTIVTDKDLFKYLEKYGLTVISLEEDIKTITAKENDTLSNLSKKYNVKTSDIMTYNNKKEKTLEVGETIKIPIKTIDNSNLEKVKKLINEKQILYIYSDSSNSNNTVKTLIEENNLEKIIINTMYSVDGGITNNNENYLTIMNNNLELYLKELNK